MALFAIASLADHGLAQSANPSVPTGTLSASPTQVQAGTYPVLTWNITHPNTVIDIIDIAPDGTITPKENLYMDIRILGASYQISSYQYGTVESYVKADGATSFTRFFQGTQNQINPATIRHTQYVRNARPIDFRSRCHNGDGWLSYRSTESLTPNVVALTNGETPPNTVPAFQQGEIESFLQPYLNSQGKVNIGPLDVIFLIELGQTNPSVSGFDLQDLVLLVTFRRV
jgi:hypothetical protein